GQFERVLVGIEHAERDEAVPAAEHDAALPHERPPERADRIGHHVTGVATCVVREPFGRHAIDDPALTKHLHSPIRRRIRNPWPDELPNIDPSYASAKPASGVPSAAYTEAVASTRYFATADSPARSNWRSSAFVAQKLGWSKCAASAA